MTQLQSERSQVQFGGRTIDYGIRRSTRRSTVSIAVDTAEGVLVIAPSRTPVERLNRVVRAKAQWIVERLKRQSDLPPPPGQREFVSGETFLYLGRQYRLRVETNDAPRQLRLEAGWLCVPVPTSLRPQYRSSYVRAALVDWYKKQAAKRLPERLGAWSEKLALKTPKLILAEPRTRWGSSSLSGTVRLNWRVIQAPLTLVDYVVAHELAHLIHPNHTPAFWAAIGRVMPDYDARKAKLRALGAALEW